MSTPKRRKRALPEEEHENHERWMVTYADMVTLLMVLFIVMFAMSKVDEERYTKLRSGLSEGFGQTTSVLAGTSALLDEGGSQISAHPLDAQELSALSPDEKLAVENAVQSAVEESNRRQVERMWAEARAEVERLRQIERQLRGALREAGLGGDVRSAIDERGLALSLVSHQVVFRPNLATLSPRGERIVDTLSPSLRRLGDDVRVDGHTNQVPVKPKYYETDWDLSAARAITVLRRLDEVGGLRQEALSVAAFGQEKPLIDPSTPGSQKLNKRVDIVVMSDLAAGSRQLLDDVVTQDELAAQRRRASGQAAEVDPTDRNTRRTDRAADRAAASNVPGTGTTSSRRSGS